MAPGLAEHERNLLLRVRDYVAGRQSDRGGPGKDWRQYLEGEGRRRIEHAKKTLGIKP